MTRAIKTVPQDLTVNQFLELVAKHHHIAYPIVNEKSEPIGWITLEEASTVEKQMRNVTFIGQIARRKLVAVYPEESALEAFKKMSKYETGRVIVFDRTNPKKILGIITKTDLMHTLTRQY
jgi:CIC family chloride channel protein